MSTDHGRSSRSGAGTLALIACLGCMTQEAAAQPYPQRPLRLLVGFPAGGTSDIVGRALADTLARGLGQTVVTDNRPGAGGNIASDLAARSPADGHTLLLSSGSNALAPSLYARLGYDILRDFDHVSVFADVTFMLAIAAGFSPRTVPELVSLAKAHPGTINFASPGVGTPSHLAGELFRITAGIDIVHVPYKGAAPALVDLLAGRVQMYFTSLPGALTHLRSGKLRALAVSGARRSAMLPDVPTVAEAGLAGYQAGSWYGLSVPAGTPATVVTRLYAEVQRGLATPELRGRLTDQGLDPIEGVTPAAATRFVREDIGRWRKVVPLAGLKPA